MIAATAVSNLRASVAALAIAVLADAAVADVIHVQGRAISIPAPKGLASASAVFPREQATTAHGFELVFVTPEAIRAVREGRAPGLDRSAVAIVTLEGLANSTNDAPNAERFTEYQRHAMSRASRWHPTLAESIHAACGRESGATRAAVPANRVPRDLEHLWLVQPAAGAIGWLAIGSDDRHPPTPGAAEIVVLGQLLVRGRCVGVVFGRTRKPTCAEIAAVERDAGEWMRAILAANR